MALASTGPALTYTSPKRRPYRVKAVMNGSIRRTRSTESDSMSVNTASLAMARASTAPDAPTCPSASLTGSVSVMTRSSPVSRRQRVGLLDHFVRPQQHRLRDSEAQRLRGFEVDYELEFRRLLDGK